GCGPMTMHLAQGSPEWFQARLGKVTASRIEDVMAKLKSGGMAAVREEYLSQVVLERITRKVLPHYVSPDMRDGIKREPIARARYAFEQDVDVVEVGFVPHP